MQCRCRTTHQQPLHKTHMILTTPTMHPKSSPLSLPKISLSSAEQRSTHVYAHCMGCCCGMYICAHAHGLRPVARQPQSNHQARRCSTSNPDQVHGTQASVTPGVVVTFMEESAHSFPRRQGWRHSCAALPHAVCLPQPSAGVQPFRGKCKRSIKQAQASSRPRQTARRIALF